MSDLFPTLAKIYAGSPVCKCGWTKISAMHYGFASRIIGHEYEPASADE